MSLKATTFRLLRNGRNLFRKFWTNPVLKDVVDVGNSASPAAVRVLRDHARRIFNEHVSRVSNSAAAELRRRTAKRLSYGYAAPFLGFLSVNLSSGTSIITEEDELEAACWGLREVVAAVDWTFIKEESDLFNLSARVDKSFSLRDFVFGEPIAKGCNGVVYSARIKCDCPVSNDVSGDESFPLAVKMMFNYDAESNAMSILRAMHRETVPALTCSLSEETLMWEDSLRQGCRALPPHPNIVRVYNAFTDHVQALPGSLSLYPDALPARLNPSGYGRNMSLFLVMKRYDMSMKDYLHQSPPNPKVAVMLLTQLLEAVTHMVFSGIAHRDLKADNILLHFDEEEGLCPNLAVTDFGCCLADKVHGLSLPYSSSDTDKGGNAALMAPEVACTRPGPFTYINYSKADVWAVGTLAYQIFGMDNPFHRISNTQGVNGREAKFLLSSSYSESDLPALPDSVPPVISKLIREMLVRDPSRRVTAELAATVCQLFLWAPSSWIERESNKKLPSSSQVLQWLLCLATKVLLEGRQIGYGKDIAKTQNSQESNLSAVNLSFRHATSEFHLVKSFLCRVKLSVIKDALLWIHKV